MKQKHNKHDNKISTNLSFFKELHVYCRAGGIFSLEKSVPTIAAFFFINKGNTKSHGHSEINFKYVTSVIALSHINAFEERTGYMQVWGIFPLAYLSDLDFFCV